MIGDQLIISKQHYQTAEKISKIILPRLKERLIIFCLSVAGESGSGKSVMARALQNILGEGGVKSVILQQDDYFIYPPRTNEKKRRADIRRVGLSEVRLDLMDEHLEQARNGKKVITKPLVLFEENRIITEDVSLKDVNIIIVEGTYTSVLENVDFRIFLNASYRETRTGRQLRNRELQDNFLEEVLKIEHKIISSHRKRANLQITNRMELEKIVVQ